VISHGFPATNATDGESAVSHHEHIALPTHDANEFEDYARKMDTEYTRLDEPTWIIGPALGSGPLPDRPAEILKVWPTRGPIKRLRPAEFDPIIERLATEHCRNPSESRRDRTT
jgi:hypothetical protein